MHVLTIEDLNVSFAARKGTTSPVQGANLYIAKGRTLALVGESGSGKTLTGIAALGLLPDAAQQSGRIVLQGNLIHRLSEKDIVPLRGRMVSIIMQEPMAAMNPIMSVGRQVEEAVRLRDDAVTLDSRRKVFELFQEVGLDRPEERYHAYPHELSGGQLQRIMIAMALARDPDILIADEPTTSLDVTIQRQILELLTALQRSRQMAMLFISHDIAVVAQMAHEVAVMYRGRIVERGNVDDILNRPQHKYTQQLLASHPEGREHKTPLPVYLDVFNTVSQEHNKEKPPLPHECRQVLKVSNLKVEYSRRAFTKASTVALKAIDLSIERGKTVGLVGESGSGKSSLAKAVLGIAPITGGNVELFGKCLASVSDQEKKLLRRRCQIVFQNSASALNPRLTVHQLLAEPYILHTQYSTKIIKNKAGTLLEEVGLSREMLERYPHELSGGQRQRVNIARTLASDPEILICDEAVSALDISVQAQVLNLLLAIQNQRGLAILFISHDLQATKHISDSICVIKDGVIVEEGPALKVFVNPDSQYTKSLVAACPSLKANRALAAGEPEFECEEFLLT